MSVEPAAKRIKLELSDPNEPLTQNDVIAFQKEALFRCLNQRRNDFNSLNEKYETSKKSYIEISMKLANIMALIVTLAKFLEPIVKVDDDKEILKQVANGDENLIVQLSDSFMKILTKFVSKEESSLADAKLLNITNEMKNLQRDKKELQYQNNKLTEEIDSLTSFYKNLVKKYDREDSLTVKRVFKKDDEEDDEESKNDNNGKSENNIKDDEPVKHESSDTSNGNLQNTDAAKEKDEVIHNYETKMSELQNQISSLKLMVEELEKFRSLNESKIISLETKLATSTHEVQPVDEKESLINKINYLVKDNEELKRINNSFLSKFQDLSNEKEVFTNKLTAEFRSNLETLKKQNLALEKDLVRIRTGRDELLSKVSVLEAERTKSLILDDMKKFLEVSNEKWEKLNIKYNNGINTDQSQDLLMKELQDMEKAFKSISELNSKKYIELINSESLISKLTVEKTKADQKYFAAMRSKDSILIENKNLVKAVTKSNEYVTQLKDSDKLLQQKIEVLHRQLTLSQNNEKRLIDSNKSESLKIIELNAQINTQHKSISHLRSENVTMIAELNKKKTLQQELEMDKKNLLLKITHLEREIEKLEKARLKSKANGGSIGSADESLVEELDNFRTLVYCSLCSKNWKTMAIKTCGHVFCENCCKERLAARMRKCPTCNNPFGSNDLLSIHL